MVITTPANSPYNIIKPILPSEKCSRTKIARSSVFYLRFIENLCQVVDWTLAFLRQLSAIRANTRPYQHVRRHRHTGSERGRASRYCIVSSPLHASRTERRRKQKVREGGGVREEVAGGCEDQRSGEVRARSCNMLRAGADWSSDPSPSRRRSGAALLLQVEPEVSFYEPDEILSSVLGHAR